MLSITEIKAKSWWGYLEEDIQELLTQSVILIEVVGRWSKDERSRLHDYSFVAFPIAKAYEGFLKKLFYDLGFINEDDYFGKRFRVGKSLNPSLDRHRMKYGVYDKIVSFSKGNELADALWQTWIECRNQLFHWFPNELKAISFEDSILKVEKVIATIDKAFTMSRVGDKYDKNNNKNQ